MSLFDGVVCDMEFDYRSEVFAGGMSGGAVGLYVLETEGTTLRVWYIYDVRAPLVERELLLEMTMSDSSSSTSPRIDVSRTTELVGIHWRDQDGCRYRQSTDGGINWTTTYTVGSNFADTSHDDAAIGFAIHAATRLACGNDGSGNYSVYRSTNGSTWAKLTDAVDSDAPIPQITVRDGNVAYYTAAASGGGTVEYHVDFDSMDDWPYTFSVVTGIATPSVTANGNPGDCAETSVTGGTGSATDLFQVVLDFMEDFQGISVTFSADYYMSSYTVNSGSRGPRYFIRGTSSGTYYTLNPDLATTEGVWVTFSTTQTVGSSLDSFAFGIGRTGLSGTFVNGTVMRIDNISLSYDDGTPVPGALWRVTGYNSSPTHDDITPTGDFIPTRTYGVAVNRASKNRIIILGEDDSSDLKRFTSNNQGDSQTDQGATSFRGAVSSSPVQILFGDNALSMSTDNGVSFDDKRGNLADVFSSMAEIRKVKALI